jgi:RING finger protein 113A
VFDSTREVKPVDYAGGATHTTDIDTQTDRDARAVLERNIKLQESGEVDTDPNVYRGLNAYKQYVKKDMAQVGNNKMTGTQGPIRAPSFLRSSIRMDYQPDICKDYKETGFCGYGDQCKFLHDRGDYKSGWQLEKEWDAMQLKKKQKLAAAAAKLIDENGE